MFKILSMNFVDVGEIYKYYTHVKNCCACVALYILGAAAFYENKGLYFILVLLTKFRLKHGTF